MMFILIRCISQIMILGIFSHQIHINDNLTIVICNLSFQWWLDNNLPAILVQAEVQFTARKPGSNITLDLEGSREQLIAIYPAILPPFTSSILIWHFYIWVAWDDTFILGSLGWYFHLG